MSICLCLSVPEEPFLKIFHLSLLQTSIFPFQKIAINKTSLISTFCRCHFIMHIFYSVHIIIFASFNIFLVFLSEFWNCIESFIYHLQLLWLNLMSKFTITYVSLTCSKLRRVWVKILYSSSYLHTGHSPKGLWNPHQIF